MKPNTSIIDTSFDSTLCITPRRTLFDGITIKIEGQGEVMMGSTPPTSPVLALESDDALKDEIDLELDLEEEIPGYNSRLSLSSSGNDPLSTPQPRYSATPAARSSPRYRVEKPSAVKHRLRFMPPWVPMPPAKGNRWCERDDYIISVLKEAYDFPWRRIATFIDNRHSWQAVQMRYLRTLKNRNQLFNAEESKRFLVCLKRDWETRFHRIACEMGNGFSVKRCIKHAFAVIGMPELAGPVFNSHDANSNSGGRFNANGLAVPACEHSFPELDDKSELPESAIKLLEGFISTDIEALASMYLLPKQLVE
ncbi:hypothetical protein TRVA0_011S00452 [Trichomonascus vanleenenianus]|uniref:uncharacterized protein n=1 Tax=Trichomonascus vanleenenianus TaxID=2268995 RepID=UPI003ECA527A